MPTDRNGNGKPPMLYSADPNTGPLLKLCVIGMIIGVSSNTFIYETYYITLLPNIYPNPNSISVHAITVEILFGYKTIKIDNTELHAAALATPSKNL